MLETLQPQNETEARSLGCEIAQNHRAVAAFVRFGAIESTAFRIVALDAAYMASVGDRYSEACYLLWLVAEEYRYEPKEKDFAAIEYARMAGLALARGAIGPEHVEEILQSLGDKPEYRLAALRGAFDNSPKGSCEREACEQLLEFAKKKKYRAAIPEASQWLGAAEKIAAVEPLTGELALGRFEALLTT